MAFWGQLLPISIFLLVLLNEAHTKKRVPQSKKLPTGQQCMYPIFRNSSKKNILVIDQRVEVYGDPVSLPTELFKAYLARIDKASYFPTCFRNDPELNKCLLTATNQVRPFLAKGVPELRIPSLEPFHIPEIQLEQQTNALNFKATLKNVIVDELSKYDFSRFDFDVPTKHLLCDLKIPGLQLKGDYTAAGSVLGAPIEGTGTFTANIDSCHVFVDRTYEEITKNGKVYIKSTSTNTTLDVTGPKIDLKGLFDGNELLNAATNKAINDNIDDLFLDLKPVIVEIVNSIMDNLTFKTLLENIPWDDLYPIKK